MTRKSFDRRVTEHRCNWLKSFPKTWRKVYVRQARRRLNRLIELDEGFGVGHREGRQGLFEKS